MKINTRRTAAIAVAAALLITLTGCFGPKNSTPEDTAKAYLEAVAANDVDTALEYTAETAIPDNIVVSNVSDPVVGETTIEGDLAYVDYSNTRSGKYSESHLALVKIDGGWFVTSRVLLDGF